MGQERIHLGTAPVFEIKEEQVFGLIRDSYERFLRKLPDIIARKFPVETKKDGHTYRMEIEDVRVGSGYTSTTYKGNREDAQAAYIHCLKNGETLSHELWTTARVYKDGHLTAKTDRPLFQFPALSPVAAFVLGGKEKAFKIIQNLEGDRFMACGEQLALMFEKCDPSSALASDLPDIVNEFRNKKTNKTTNLNTYEFRIYPNAVNELSRQNTTIPVDGRNPLSQIASETALYHEMPGSKRDDPKGPFVNRGEISAWKMYWESMTAKKEGPKVLLNGNVAFLAKIDENGRLVTPMHTVSPDGTVNEEIVWKGFDELPAFCRYIPVGEKIPKEEPVFYSREDTVTSDGRPVSPEEIEAMDPRDARDLRQTVVSDYKDFGEISGEQFVYVPISPLERLNAAELTLSFQDNINPARRGMDAGGHTRQVIAAEGIGPSRVTTMQTTLPLVKATKAALFSDVTGKVVKADGHEIVIETMDKELKSYELDAILTRNSTTDQRYKPVVKAGDRIAKGELIADGPHTRGGEMYLGVPDLLCGFFPYRVDTNIINGKVITGHGAGGTNNNDSVIISDEMAAKFRHKEIAKVTCPLPDSAALGNNKGDPRFGENGILRIGEQVEFGDTILDKRITDEVAEVSMMDILADEELNTGRTVNQDKLKKKIKGTVVGAEVINGNVVYHFEFERELRPGDKLTVTGGEGNKFTVSSIVPKKQMPAVVYPDGTKRHFDMIVDVLSINKRGTMMPQRTILEHALMIEGKYATVGQDENDIVGIQMAESVKAGLPPDGMLKVEFNCPKTGYEQANHRVPLQTVGCATISANCHEAADANGLAISANGIGAKEVSLDRMGNQAMEAAIPEGEGFVEKLNAEKMDKAMPQIESGARILKVGKKTMERV